MKPRNGKILVSVNMEQKDTISIGGITVSTALKYETNYREKSPTVAVVEVGNDKVKNGDILLCHHNLFYQPSPYYLQDNLFSIPFGNILFAKIDNEGKISPICGNLICQRVEIPTTFPLPIEQRKTYINRAIVLDGRDTRYKKGQLIFHRPNAGYDIVYVFNGVENRVTKVHKDQICAIME